MQIKYSFIIPVYGVEKYIRQCVDSILAQTYRSFEIIIVDDESSDNCGRIADEYAEKYPQFVRAFHQKNTGAGGARNRGISVAKGEFILFVDGDDYIVSNMLEIIEKYKENHDDDLLLFSYKAVRDKDKKRTNPVSILITIKKYHCRNI